MFVVDARCEKLPQASLPDAESRATLARSKPVAYRSLASDVRTGKRVASTLVWQLEDRTHHTIDCVATTYGDGLVHLCTEKEGVREHRGVFPDARAAVRTALDLERSFMTDGWAKVV
jgi:hypothetical protein